MLPFLAAAAKKAAAAVAAAPAASPSLLARRLLHRHHHHLHLFATPSSFSLSQSPRLQTDGVVRETGHPRLRRLAVGGIGGANSAAIDPSLAAGAPSLPLRLAKHDARATDQQRMASEQEVIAGAEDSATSAEWMPQRTP